MHDVDDYPDAQTIPGLVVYRYDAPLFFANAEDFRRRALAAADQQPGPVRWFVLNVEANVEVDFTALEAVDALREDITGRGAVFALARVKQDLLARDCRPSAWPARSGRNCCSRPCPPRCRPTRHGPGNIEPPACSARDGSGEGHQPWPAPLHRRNRRRRILTSQQH